MGNMENTDIAAGIRVLANVLNEAPTEDKLSLLETISRDDSRASLFWGAHVGDNEKASIELRVDWTKLFRGLSPDNGPRPPYELVYVPVEDEMAGLLEIKRMYGKAGLALSEDARNRPDYLGFELDFAAFLLEHESEGDLPFTFDEYSKKHLGWVPEFCSEALAYAKTGFFEWYLESLRIFAGEITGGFEDE